jgi:hypothetical protein
MVAALKNFYLPGVALARHAINETVLMGNAARPLSMKFVFEGLWLPQPLKTIALNISDQTVDYAQNLLVCFAPEKIVLFGP